jgi:hypothetical protein
MGEMPVRRDKMQNRRFAETAQTGGFADNAWL